MGDIREETNMLGQKQKEVGVIKEADSGKEHLHIPTHTQPPPTHTH